MGDAVHRFRVWTEWEYDDRSVRAPSPEEAVRQYVEAGHARWRGVNEVTVFVARPGSLDTSQVFKVRTGVRVVELTEGDSDG